MSIHIMKEGFKKFAWDPEQGKEVEKPFREFHDLRECVEYIEEGFTLGDLVRNVYENSTLQFFFSAYSWCPLEEFYKELTSALTLQVPQPGEYASVRGIMELSGESKKYKIAKSANFYWDFSGIGPGPEDCSALELSPLSEIANLPLRADSVMFVDSRGKTYMREGGFECKPSLLEFVDAVLWEISCHGGPTKRDAVREEMVKSIQEVLDGTAETKPFSELVRNLEAEKEEQ